VPVVPIHDDEVRATAGQVHRLVAAQRPQWADLPVTPLPDEVEGTDHVLFRIGGELAARMPKIARAAGQAGSDARWLPVLASRLPVRIPVPLHLGEPGAGYPWRWTVVPWIAGSTPPGLGCDDVPLARDVAAFARALHGVDPAGGPVKPPGSRGSALRHADDGVRRVLPRLAGHDDGFDVTAAAAAWDACLAAAARDAYREAIGYDDATWRRACGWALAPSLAGIDYYRHTFPRMAEHGRRMVRAVIAELA
jgi:aminoglycoside phosphotransferase (APT) family kinase protein